MYTFTFVAHPQASHPSYGEIDGAYAIVFVNDPLAESAEAAARGLVEESGWDIVKMNGWGPAEKGEHTPGSTWYEYYEQALQDGVCAVLHTWPVGAPDADEA